MTAVVGVSWLVVVRRRLAVTLVSGCCLLFVVGLLSIGMTMVWYGRYGTVTTMVYGVGTVYDGMMVDDDVDRYVRLSGDGCCLQQQILTILTVDVVVDVVVVVVVLTTTTKLSGRCLLLLSVVLSVCAVVDVVGRWSMSMLLLLLSVVVVVKVQVGCCCRCLLSSGCRGRVGVKVDVWVVG